VADVSVFSMPSQAYLDEVRQRDPAEYRAVMRKIAVNRPIEVDPPGFLAEMDAPDESPLRPADVAARLGVATPSVRVYVHKRLIPQPHRDRRGYWWPERDLVEFSRYGQGHRTDIHNDR